MSNRTISVDDRLYDYLLRVSVREPPVLAELRRETMQLPLSNMQIAPEQGRFMALLVELMGVQKAIEVGTFTGYSALSIAMALPDGGSLVCCDTSEEWTSVARRYWQKAGVSERIDLRIAPAADTLSAMLEQGESGSYDFAFIDADKQNYTTYYEYCLTLLRRGGLIAVDNTLWDGDVADPDNNEPSTRAIREFNERLSGDERITLSLVPIGDGLTLAVKR